MFLGLAIFASSAELGNGLLAIDRLSRVKGTLLDPGSDSIRRVQFNGLLGLDPRIPRHSLAGDAFDPHT